MKDIIQVLVVDDSPTTRDILIGMLTDTDGLHVIGAAQDGLEAVELTAQLRPDVITMDIRMPRLNGLEATRRIMSSTPTPIVVVSSNIYEADLNIAFNAMAVGALTVVEKPRGLDLTSYIAVREQLVTAVRLMADVQVVALMPNAAAPVSSAPTLAEINPTRPIELIAIAASAGGPGTLREILQALPGDLSIPMVVVQHITRGFGQGFAHWLDGLTPLHVSIAQPDQRLTAGQVLIAPDDTHLTIGPGGIVQLDQAAPVNGSRPSATRLFESIARTYGPAAIGVILSGMGDDGVEGLARLRAAGGHVIAQNEESCAVFGMPKAAIERGIVDQVLTPNAIAATLLRLNGHHRSA